MRTRSVWLCIQNRQDQTILSPARGGDSHRGSAQLARIGPLPNLSAARFGARTREPRPGSRCGPRHVLGEADPRGEVAEVLKAPPDRLRQVRVAYPRVHPVLRVAAAHYFWARGASNSDHKIVKGLGDSGTRLKRLWLSCCAPLDPAGPRGDASEHHPSSWMPGCGFCLPNSIPFDEASKIRLWLLQKTDPVQRKCSFRILDGGGRRGGRAAARPSSWQLYHRSSGAGDATDTTCTSSGFSADYSIIPLSVV